MIHEVPNEKETLKKKKEKKVTRGTGESTSQPNQQLT